MGTAGQPHDSTAPRPAKIGRKESARRQPHPGGRRLGLLAIVADVPHSGHSMGRGGVASATGRGWYEGPGRVVLPYRSHRDRTAPHGTRGVRRRRARESAAARARARGCPGRPPGVLARHGGRDSARASPRTARRRRQRSGPWRCRPAPGTSRPRSRRRRGRSSRPRPGTAPRPAPPMRAATVSADSRSASGRMTANSSPP